MSYRVVFSDRQQHKLDERVLPQFAEVDAKFAARHSVDGAGTIAFRREAEAIMTSWTLITEAVIQAATHCQVIPRIGTGYDNVACWLSGLARASLSKHRITILTCLDDLKTRLP